MIVWPFVRSFVRSVRAVVNTAQAGPSAMAGLSTTLCGAESDVTRHVVFSSKSMIFLSFVKPSQLSISRTPYATPA